jgi:hypothetical protein
MADILSSTPIESITEGNPVKVSGNLTANALANPIIVQISDGASAISSTGTSLDVNLTNASVAVTATDLDIRPLQAGSLATDDNILIYANTAKDGTIVNGSGVAVKVDDSAFTIGSDNVAPIAGIYETGGDTVDDGDVGALRMTQDRKLQIDIGSVSATAVPVSANGTSNSETNPLYVQNVQGVVSGIEVIDYDTASSVASQATSNHDYTVTATKTLKVIRVTGSSAGAQKIELQSGPLASLATKQVAFTSQSNQTWVMEFDGRLEVPDTSTGTLRIARTNRERVATDLYSTIIATEV